jgi:hypothetical protein
MEIYLRKTPNHRISDWFRMLNLFFRIETEIPALENASRVSKNREDEKQKPEPCR